MPESESMGSPATRLEGRYLRLEALHAAHAPSLRKAVDLDLFHFMPYRPEDDSEDAAVEYIGRLNARPYWHPYAIIRREEGDVVGVSAYFEVRAEHFGLEIGNTWIARPHQSTRVNPEAKYLMLRHAFDDLRAIRVELKTDIRNLQSRRGIEKLGATQEGVLRNHMILPDGHIRDTVVFSIRREEWPEVRRNLVSRLGYQP